MSYRNYVQEQNKWKNDYSIGNPNFVKDEYFDSLLEDKLEIWREYLSLWKSKPDLFIDFIKDKNCKYNLTFYQRMMLRAFFRYNKVFVTATRGSIKSLTLMMAMYLKCIFYPGVKLFVCAPGKEQAAKIAQDKLQELWDLYPLLGNECRHKTFNRDYTKIVFPNNSQLSVVQLKDAERGGRKNGGCIEEIADPKFDGEKLHTVVIPQMTNDRVAACGQVDPDEIQRTQWYVTTAGTRQTFAFQKLQEIIGEMAAGKDSFSLGFSYELPVELGVLNLDFINQEKESPSFSPLAFLREYGSVWTGSSQNALVNLEDLNKTRTLENAEFKATNEKDVDYVLAYDVARIEGRENANCCLAVIKIVPRGDGTYQKRVVNLYSFEGTHFRDQALFLKRKVNDFNARVLVVDAIGLGRGLIDELVLEIDDNPPYSVINDESYKKYKQPNSIEMVYAMQASSKDTKNSDMHNHFMNIFTNNGVKLLAPESVKKQKLMEKRKKRMDEEKLAEELLPFLTTDLLAEEIMNLEFKQTGNKTQVQQISRSITKDKYSALLYGLYWIYLLEMKNKAKKKEEIDVGKFFKARKPKIGV